MHIGHSTAPARPAATSPRQDPTQIDWNAVSSWAAPAGAGWVVIGGRALADQPVAA